MADQRVIDAYLGAHHDAGPQRAMEEEILRRRPRPRSSDEHDEEQA